MKIRLIQIFVLVAFICARALAVADYATDIATVGEAQTQALEQAMQMLAQAKKPEIRDALNKAMQDMKHAQLMLADAKNSPEKLTAALTAEEAAYQGASLKTISHEFPLVSRSKVQRPKRRTRRATAQRAARSTRIGDQRKPLRERTTWCDRRADTKAKGTIANR